MPMVARVWFFAPYSCSSERISHHVVYLEIHSKRFVGNVKTATMITTESRRTPRRRALHAMRVIYV